jgi:pyruvate dehydrogenase E2 component (dihydrolipoamide acetyltransferase)
VVATDFLLPDIGEGLTEAEIIRWLVAEGDTVVVDQPIVEIETDKALMEIPTPYAGRVVAHGAPEGSVLDVGQVLVTIQTAADEAGAEPARSEIQQEAAPIVGTISSDAVDLTPREAPNAGIPSAAGVEALPIVRRLAADLGVDLSAVTGTGADGRITREDVQRAAAKTATAQMAGEARQTAEPATDEPEMTIEGGDRPEEPEISTRPGDGDTEAAPTASMDPVAPAATPAPSTSPERVQMSKLRRTIAERVEASWREIPHVTTFGAADVTRLLASRAALKRRRGQPVSIDAMLVKAVVVALGRHREMTARLEGDVLIYPERVDIGVAVDTEDGLMVVVTEDPARRDLVELTADIARLSDGARNRTLPAGSFGGQAFTVSNIGAVGGGYGTPIVPMGTTAILSAGKADDEPVARNGRLEIAPMMPLSLSYDHRVIDGAAGRRFLATVVENLEEPTLFLA